MIRDYEASQRITDYFLLKNVTARKTKTGSNYLDIMLKDVSGEISAKLWNASDQAIEDFKTGNIVKVMGTTEMYGQNLQFRIEKIRRANPDEVDMTKLVDSAPIDVNVMFDEITSTIESIGNSDIKAIATTLISRYEDNFKKCPAAKVMHHAMPGGLLFHTYSMLVNAKKLVETYSFLNTDLLYAGVIIHDICKTEEMQCNDAGIVEAYTTEGQLLGHIIQCVCEIENVSRELGITSEVPLLLKHMVLSHHYEPEYGSPKYPMFPEAEMLHYLDVMDAKMNQLETVFNNTKENEFSSRLRMLNNRNVYHYSIEEDN